MTEKAGDLVSNISEESVFVTVVGTNSVASGRTEDILRKYGNLIRRLKEHCKKTVCGLLPRFGVGSVHLSRMTGVNSRLE